MWEEEEEGRSGLRDEYVDHHNIFICIMSRTTVSSTTY